MVTLRQLYTYDLRCISATFSDFDSIMSSTNFIFSPTLIAAGVLLATVMTAQADIADEARNLIDSGDYRTALSLLEPNAKGGGPKLAMLMGECLFLDGAYKEAVPWLEEARRKGVPDASLLLGRIAFLNYDFDKASNYYAAYRKTASSNPANQDLDPDVFQSQLSTAEGFLERVEDIVILDSIAVSDELLLRTFRLPSSAGSVTDPEVIPFDDARHQASMAFVSESGDFMMWAQPDDEGYSRLVESYRLTDGSWDKPQYLPIELNGGGDTDYPFMMPDGTTLYFASDGEGSIGGYDIFVASRDASTGEFMQPQNIGFPYNSPFDDYLMAIDEENGIGWWVTDRNRLDKKLTVYVYRLNELRHNLNPDDDDLTDRARITSIAATHPEGTDVRMPDIDTSTNASLAKADFHLPMPKGREYTTLADFRNKQAADVMRKYLERSKAYDKECEKLAEARHRYSSRPDASQAAEVRRLEASTAESRSELRRLRSDIYRLELGRN